LPNLNDLNLVEEDNIPDIDPDELAGQIGSYIPVPQPGTYRFKLPGDLTSVYETVDTPKGQRIKAVFRDESALFVETLNQPFPYVALSSEEREVGKAKKPGAELAYLLTALGEDKLPGFSNSRGYAQALQKHSGESFVADVDWSVNCSTKKDIWVFDEEAKKTIKKEGTKGCGRLYATSEFDSKNANGGKSILIPKYEDGNLSDRFPCECGAQLKVSFPRLKNFKQAK
jgi:hypothetical protein